MNEDDKEEAFIIVQGCAKSHQVLFFHTSPSNNKAKALLGLKRVQIPVMPLLKPCIDVAL